MEMRHKRTVAVTEVIAGSLIWLMNLYRLPTHIQHAGFMDAATSVMILFLGPALVWEAIQRLK